MGCGQCCFLYSEPLNLGVGSPCQMVTFLVTPFLWSGDCLVHRPSAG